MEVLIVTEQRRSSSTDDFLNLISPRLKSEGFSLSELPEDSVSQVALVILTEKLADTLALGGIDAVLALDCVEFSRRIVLVVVGSATSTVLAQQSCKVIKAELENLEQTVEETCDVLRQINQPLKDVPISLQSPSDREFLSRVFSLPKGFDPLGEMTCLALQQAKATQLEQSDKAIEWYGDSRKSQDRILGFIGPVGCGKSVLLASLCARNQGVFPVAAMHFFKRSDNAASSLRVCIRSIANQLAQAVPGVQKELESLVAETDQVDDLSVLFTRVVCKPLERVPKPAQELLVVLDGLDQVSREDKSALCLIVSELWNTQVPSWLSLVFSCRPGFYNSLSAASFSCSILSAVPTHSDLFEFWECRLIGMVPESSLSILESRTHSMIELSKSNFMYASFAASSFSRLPLLDALKEIDFPTGLADVYRQYFAWFLEDALDNDYDRYTSLLSVLVAWREVRMDKELLGRALGLDQAEMEEMWIKATAFLVAANNNKSIQFAHPSMRHFLRDRKLAGNVPVANTSHADKRLSVPVGHGHRALIEALEKDKCSAVSLKHLLYHYGEAKEWEAVQSCLLDYAWLSALSKDTDALRQVLSDLCEFRSKGKLEGVGQYALEVVHVLDLHRDDLFEDPCNSKLDDVLHMRIGDENHPLFVQMRERNLLLRLMPQSRAGKPLVSPNSNSSTELFRRRTEQSISCVAVDENYVVAALHCFESSECVIWSLVTGESRKIMFGAKSVGIAGGVLAALRTDSCAIRFWDCKSLFPLGEVEFDDGFGSACFDVNAEAAVVGRGSLVSLWEFHTWKEQSFYSKDVNSANFTVVALDHRVIVGGTSCNVEVWERDTGVLLRSWKAAPAEITAVAVQGNLVATACVSTTLRLWDLDSGKCMLRVNCLGIGDIHDVDLDQGKLFAASVTKDDKLTHDKCLLRTITVDIQGETATMSDYQLSTFDKARGIVVGKKNFIAVVLQHGIICSDSYFK